MKHYLTPYNPNDYDAVRSFLELGTVDWTINSREIREGDIVYFYGAKPEQEIKIKGIVTEINIDLANSILDKDYYLNSKQYEVKSEKKLTRVKLIEIFDNEKSNKLKFNLLRDNGLKGYVQSCRNLDKNKKLLDYILNVELSV